MKKLKTIFKIIIIIIFLGSFSGSISIYTIRKTALNEKTLESTAENKDVLESIYTEFIEIMNADFIALFSGIISKEEIENEFRTAYPEEKFKNELKELLKNVSKYLRDEVSTPNRNLDLTEFKKKISIFLKSKAETEKISESKKLLLRYSDVVLHYPDNFPMLRLDDIEHIDEMKENLSRLKSVLTPFLIVALISLIILLFNIRLFALGILMTGIINAIGTFAVSGNVAAVLAKNPEPARTIATTVAAQTINSILVLSIILIVIGIIILGIKRKTKGGT